MQLVPRLNLIYIFFDLKLSYDIKRALCINDGTKILELQFENLKCQNGSKTSERTET